MSQSGSQSKATTPPIVAAPAAKNRPHPGYVRARKTLDFGNTGQCWDLENQVKAVAVEVLGPDGATVKAIPVFLFDPCQASQNDANGNPIPLKTATVYPTANQRQALMGVFPGRFAFTDNVVYVNAADTVGKSPGLVGVGPQADSFSYYNRKTSALATSQTVLIDTRGLNKSLAIQMLAPTSTATLEVHVTTDNAATSSNFPATTGTPISGWANNDIKIDAIATAASIVKQYTETTVGANVALSPLSFRWIMLIVGAAGAGVATTIDFALK